MTYRRARDEYSKPGDCAVCWGGKRFTLRRKERLFGGAFQILAGLRFLYSLEEALPAVDFGLYFCGGKIEAKIAGIEGHVVEIMELFDFDGFIEEGFAALLLFAEFSEKLHELALEACFMALDVTQTFFAGFPGDGFDQCGPTVRFFDGGD